MNDGDLLAPDDPFLPHVRRAAARDRRAFDWLTDSATAWARGEFVRRVEDEDDDTRTMALDVLLGGLKGRQVAVLTTHLQLGATQDDRGLSVPDRRSRWTVHIGVLIDGQMPSDHGYLNLDKGTEKLAGMFDVMDVFLLPDVWRVTPWPKFDPPKPDSEEPRPIWNKRRDEEIKRVMEQASQMTTVGYDPRDDTYTVGKLVLKRDDLVLATEEQFVVLRQIIGDACARGAEAEIVGGRVLREGDTITVTTRLTQT